MPVNQHAKQRKKCTETPANVVTQRLRRVAIIAMPPVRMLDVFGPAGSLSVTSLARRAAMSPRNFARVFTQEVGETPARHIENIRLEAARRQLETTSLSLDEIAETSGFQSAEILRRTFARRLGVTPGQYRTAFGSTARRH